MNSTDINISREISIYIHTQEEQGEMRLKDIEMVVLKYQKDEIMIRDRQVNMNEMLDTAETKPNRSKDQQVKKKNSGEHESILRERWIMEQIIQ